MQNSRFNWKSLVGLCLGYFAAYVVYGTFVRWLRITQEMPGMEVTFNTTVGGTLICMVVVLVFWWPGRLVLREPRVWGGRIPGEYAWLVPSGICTGFVIVTTTLMYTYGFSVMVAMVLMRSALIVSSRAVDAILIRQGHVTKPVYWQENAAVVAAVAAMSVVIFVADKDDFKFFESSAAMITMLFYIIPYSLRIYILNRFKTQADHKAIFGIEQIAASSTIFLVMGAVVIAYLAGWNPTPVAEFAAGVFSPTPVAILIGMVFGIGAFFSVFLFLFKDGSATFNVTLNRLTSLTAGTVATLCFWLLFDGQPVKSYQWAALGVVLLAIGLLAWAGKRRKREAA
ncbi:MAG: hypothetical protein P9L99_19725 [Candidatus Lernaella stagnicola]|nr:hypothetical protein [Candidatus Lernaella stagnicola]